MAETITDDIALVVGILKTALPNVTVSTEIPASRPSRYVNVALSADQSDMFLKRPTVALTVWGITDADAHGLALSALHALTDAAQTHDLLSSADLQTMSRDEWTNTGQARYLVEIDLTINY